MAVHANHITLLIFGFIFLINKCSACVTADPFKLNRGFGDHVHLEPEKLQSAEIDFRTNTDNNLQSENKENEFPVLQERGFSIGGISFGSIFNRPKETSFSTGDTKRLQVYNVAGVTIRAVDLKNHQNIMIVNNKIFVGGKLVCDDVNNLDNEITYKKTSDGTYWYTNVKIGTPMTPAEIEEFEKDWTQYEKEKAEKKELKKADKNKRKDEKQDERERKKQRKEAEKRLKEEEREIKKKMKAEEKERTRKEKEAAKERARRAKEFAKEEKRQRKFNDEY